MALHASQSGQEEVIVTGVFSPKDPCKRLLGQHCPFPRNKSA